MIGFSTLVDDGHVWHRSLDGEPLRGQPNATFAHRIDWVEHCRFCSEVNAVFTREGAIVRLAQRIIDRWEKDVSAWSAA